MASSYDKVKKGPLQLKKASSNSVSLPKYVSKKKIKKQKEETLNYSETKEKENDYNEHESTENNDSKDPDQFLTISQKVFREAQKLREGKRVDDKLKLSHRQRVEKLNKHLSTLSEHFDIPKVGPG